MSAHEAFQLLPLSIASYENDKKPLSPRFEPVNWLLEGCVDTNQTNGATGHVKDPNWVIHFYGAELTQRHESNIHIYAFIYKRSIA